MDALVTGASGFLGGALTERLVRDGASVRVLVRPTGNLERLRDLPIHTCYGSLEDPKSLAPALEDVDRVYHCAALASDWAPWRAFHRANIAGVRNLLEAAAGIERFVHISTTDVYGYPINVCDEAHPLVDTGLPYNRSKVAGERIVMQYHRDTGLPVTIIRPATIYGPESQSCVGEIAGLLEKGGMVYLNGGRSGAGLLYIDNAVTGILQAAGSPRTIGEAYNLRDETDYTWREFVEALAARMGVPSPRLSIPGRAAWVVGCASEAAYGMFGILHRPLLTRHAVRLFCRDQNYPIEKARAHFGFRSGVSFDEAMERTCAWLQLEAAPMLSPGG